MPCSLMTALLTKPFRALFLTKTEEAVTPNGMFNLDSNQIGMKEMDLNMH